MIQDVTLRCALFVLIGLLLPGAVRAAPEQFASHPPMHPLPEASTRPMAEGKGLFVDTRRGDDSADGSSAKPWKTINRGLKALAAGDTLYLRSGIYHEDVHLGMSGTADKPITIRSAAGELAIIDGSIPDFSDDPATAWEPVPDGVKGEYRSTKAYPGLESTERIHAHVLGAFADSMVPLHGYRHLIDLRSDNEYWNTETKVTGGEIYCGPGVWYDLNTKKIHIRLAHTNWKFLDERDKYRGETDPRKVKLLIDGARLGSLVKIFDARHVRLQDLVIRGSKPIPLEIAGAEDVELDGVTVYLSGAPVTISNTKRLKLKNSAIRGISAPWTFRAHLKYRGLEAKVMHALSGNSDFEFAYNEFTDSCDGLFIGPIRNLKFHHNLVDNMNDDGFNVTANMDEQTQSEGGNIHIYQNVLRRCLGMFVHGGRRVGAEQAGAGVYIYRNIIDLRPPVHYGIPSPGEERVTSTGKLMGDHGRGSWEPTLLYHNTILSQEIGNQGGYGLGAAAGAARAERWRVLNNIFVQIDGEPGLFVRMSEDAKKDGEKMDFLPDGNIHWCVKQGASYKGHFAEQLRSTAVRVSKRDPSNFAKWAQHDLVTDPKFEGFKQDWREPADLRLSAESPAINAGVEIPSDWPDSLRSNDKGMPDIGALSLGHGAEGVGVRGRLKP